MKLEKIIEIFNHQTSELLDQLQQTFPDECNEPSTQSLIIGLESAMMLTPSVPVILFFKNVVRKYGSYIEKRDGDFFMNWQPKNKDLKGPIDIIKNVYAIASDSNRDIVWDYLERLRKLSQLYNQRSLHEL